jgi:hypothetical protein
MVVYLRKSFGTNTINVVEAFAMPCDRSSAGPSIMNDRQAAIERGHGGRCRSAVGITRNVAEAFEAIAITSFVGTCHQSWQVCSP